MIVVCTILMSSCVKWLINWAFMKSQFTFYLWYLTDSIQYRIIQTSPRLQELLHFRTAFCIGLDYNSIYKPLNTIVWPQPIEHIKLLFLGKSYILYFFSKKCSRFILLKPLKKESISKNRRKWVFGILLVLPLAVFCIGMNTHSTLFLRDVLLYLICQLNR